MSGRDERTTKKIVINTKHGGFGLSQEACLRLIELGYDKLTPIPEEEYHEWYPNGFYGVSDIPRDNLLLVRVVEELGVRVNGPHALLKVVEIPYDVGWSIEEYDGLEWIAEEHRTWN